MKGLLFFFYGVNICWLWGCLVYMFVAIMKHNKGKWSDIYLQGNRIICAFVMVLFWLFYILLDARDSYFYMNENVVTQLSMVDKVIREGFNTVSSICCTLLILGYGIKK